ncbi:hypothetical protein LWI28_002869 [Acer negundo]|uniref:Uncharacterized protein n=1 Tax=Acer negundo TaxID=4023 RepID=A0AAD5JRE6_ACENE|nr:hypothetical protein LWI28_002869 [Acer negundo]
MEGVGKERGKSTNVDIRPLKKASPSKVCACGGGRLCKMMVVDYACSDEWLGKFWICACDEARFVLVVVVDCAR